MGLQAVRNGPGGPFLTGDHSAWKSLGPEFTYYRISLQCCMVDKSYFLKGAVSRRTSVNLDTL